MIGDDEPGLASMARYAYLTAGEWRDRYRVDAFSWRVPVDYRTRYADVYILALVKGVAGEVADLRVEL